MNEYINKDVWNIMQFIQFCEFHKQPKTELFAALELEALDGLNASFLSIVCSADVCFVPQRETVDTCCTNCRNFKEEEKEFFVSLLTGSEECCGLWGAESHRDSQNQ